MVLINNRPPIVTGDITVLAGEDVGIFTINPTSNVIDPDMMDLPRVVDVPVDLPPGVTWDPQWHLFFVDTNHPAFQSLRAGQQMTLSITYGVTDLVATVSDTINIVVTGANDQAVITGVSFGSVTEDAATVATGTLAVTDIDSGEAAFQAITVGLAGSYGSLTMTAAGDWTYTLDPVNAAVQALNAGQSLTDTLVVRSVDGTAQTLTITINGSNETVITGTAAADVLTGTASGEAMFGLGGNDRLTGNGGPDTLDGGAGADSLYGGDGDDLLVFDATDRVQSAGAGIDTLSVSRSVTVNLGATDQISGDSGVASGFENVDATYATAGVVLTGSAGVNLFAGGAGADRLTGGLGADVLTGNGGADRFIYRTVSESQGAAQDEIADFTHGVDRIDLSQIDAIASSSNNNTFSFIGAAAFGRAGQLRYDAASGVVEADVTGDRVADFSLQVGAGLTITAGDFVL